MKKHIVCLGDSNTHGYCADPNDCADRGDRFNENERWPRVLEIRRRFGKNAILRGMNLQEGATSIDRNRQIGGHRA